MKINVKYEQDIVITLELDNDEIVYTHKDNIWSDGSYFYDEDGEKVLAIWRNEIVFVNEKYVLELINE